MNQRRTAVKARFDFVSVLFWYEDEKFWYWDVLARLKRGEKIGQVKGREVRREMNLEVKSRRVTASAKWQQVYGNKVLNFATVALVGIYGCCQMSMLGMWEIEERH